MFRIFVYLFVFILIPDSHLNFFSVFFISFIHPKFWLWNLKLNEFWSAIHMLLGFYPSFNFKYTFSITFDVFYWCFLLFFSRFRWCQVFFSIWYNETRDYGKEEANLNFIWIKFKSEMNEIVQTNWNKPYSI